jgi:hypothetical protein
MDYVLQHSRTHIFNPITLPLTHKLLKNPEKGPESTGTCVSSGMERYGKQIRTRIRIRSSWCRIVDA